MHTSPARAPRGDPDMTRRLPGKAYLRRQGQTRCYEGQCSDVVQPRDLAAVLPSSELNSLCCEIKPQVYERLRRDTEKSLPQPAGSLQESDPCCCRLSVSSSRYKLKNQHSKCQQETPLNTANSYRKVETEGTTVPTSGQWNRSHFDKQVSIRDCEQSRTAPKRGRRIFFPSSILLLYILLLLPKTFVAKPATASEQESPDHFILKTPLCEPVSHEDLIKIMGPYFDPSKMAADEPAARRNRLSNYFDHSSAPGFQGDDPRATRVPGSDSLVQEEIVYVSDEDTEWDDDNDEIDDKRIWIKEKEYMEDTNEGDTTVETIEEDEEIVEDPRSSRRVGIPEWENELPGLYKHKHRQFRTGAVKSKEHHRRHRVVPDSYAYMKRRRRRRSLQNSQNGDALSRRYNYVNNKNNVSRYDSETNDSNFDWASSKSLRGRRDARSEEGTGDTDASKRSDIGLLPLQIVASKKPEKKLRKSLKQKFRKNAKYLMKRKPPWQCKMTAKTLIMADGIFPRVLVDGNCGENRKCFYRLYNCEPQRYIIKLMQRDPNHCNPLPSVGNKTMFEERWNLISRQITVGCNCVNAPLKRRKSNKRWRSSRRKTSGLASR